MVSSNQVTANQLVWWIDNAGILHCCAQITTPPKPDTTQGAPAHHYAQGCFNPTNRAGTITHFADQHASLANIPRELFDVLDARFPQTRWWIPDQTNTTTPQKTNPVPAAI